ncbi:MAG: Type 3 secretion system secretin [Chlamydiales bacterium]|nr:Type 3 secretion system secretin [Chlamydiales bacterium]MCH9619628.1 Type 3 secretion system secretin [Chlamydiales bacterium]MCH9623234.1 Type 3 secretion system secretin [Chlamydiales bacterium]
MKKYLVLFPYLLSASLFGQTIAEKKESFAKHTTEYSGEVFEELRLVNETLEEKQFELRSLSERVAHLYQTKAEETEYRPLIEQIKLLRAEIDEIQEMWRKEASSMGQADEYALWHQPDTTLFQLVMDYGSIEHVYFVPPEIGSLRTSLQSNLPIPRESWSECLELLLAQYGVGVKQLNPYLKELYFYQNDLSSIKMITDKQSDLDVLPVSARVCYILTPKSTDPRSTLSLLQRFCNLSTTSIDMIAGKVFITAPVSAIQELMKLYSFVKDGEGLQESQVISLSKVDAKEMETILNTAFNGGSGETYEGSMLRVIPLESLSQSLFLSGTRDEVQKATKLIHDVESTVEDPQEKTVFWYSTKHSDAEELATVLARVYDLLTGQASPVKNSKIEEVAKEKQLAVSTKGVKPGEKKSSSHKTADGQNNFVVDPKTGAIIMVVEQEALPKIKELLKKLDVPKKMVQIEVLLFEKKMSNNNNFGLNLLRLGSEAVSKNKMGLAFGGATSGASGILDFFVSRKKTDSGIPAYDAAYQFLVSQEDVQINASPSVTTMNQTPATIAIVEEISIDAGANEKKQSLYDRAQYGIVMEITPTINMEEGEEGEICCITLDTDITFDTTNKNQADRPDVTRRHIKNHVRIADGETVILGGLRRKNTQDSKDSLPFLGEIPGVGKLFSTTKRGDNSTEMFVFITPKIIDDPIEDAQRLKKEELKKRPGDVPEFLHELLEAKAREKKRLFQGSLTALFGRTEGSVSASRKHQGEYDGR